MLNAPVKTENKLKLSDKKLISGLYVLPKQEKIKTFYFSRNHLFLFGKPEILDLYKRFSLKNRLEKYSIKDSCGKLIAEMSLKTYKDSVYIIDFNFLSFKKFNQSVNILVEVAKDRAISDTSEKEVRLNLGFSQNLNSRLKKFMFGKGFTSVEAQSNYEKEMFGEQLVFKASDIGDN